MVLALPERTDPAPAVILMHGCAGITGTEIGWATTLKALGIATFIVDSFRGRALAQTCGRSESLNLSSAMTDAYSALELLAVIPRIDRTRIAIMGFSLGGLTALRASQVRFQKHFAKGSNAFCRPPGLLPCWVSHQACRRRANRRCADPDLSWYGGRLDRSGSVQSLRRTLAKSRQRRRPHRVCRRASFF